jgi:hypothetical protein
MGTQIAYRYFSADVIRTVLGADEGASATELLLGEASELLSVIAQTDAAACARHVLSREGVSLLLLVMGSPTSGTLARQQIVRLLRRFVSAGSGTQPGGQGWGAMKAPF